MGTHALYVRFPDGTIRHGSYASASDLARPYLFDSQEAAAAARYSHDAPYDAAVDGFGEPVDVATVYGGGFHWRGTAIRDRLTSGGDPFGADGYADGIPGWLDEHLRAACEQANTDLAEALTGLADALDEYAGESLEWASATFEATAETWPRDQICGHCHRPITQASRGIAADGTVLCHTGTLPPDAEPADCYKLVTQRGHVADGSCCRNESPTPEENTMSNLVDHARRELELIPEDPETVEGLCRVVQAFADMGHSGGSASVAIPMLEKLLRFEPLTPLTYGPDEWIDQSEASGAPMWQNRRDSKVFSVDGGVTHYRLT